MGPGPPEHGQEGHLPHLLLFANASRRVGEASLFGQISCPGLCAGRISNGQRYQSLLRPDQRPLGLVFRSSSTNGSCLAIIHEPLRFETRNLLARIGKGAANDQNQSVQKQGGEQAKLQRIARRY